MDHNGMDENGQDPELEPLSEQVPLKGRRRHTVQDAPQWYHTGLAYRDRRDAGGTGGTGGVETRNVYP